MLARKKKKASKPSRVPTVDSYSDCSYCGTRFNWRYEFALVNAAGKEFCGERCFKFNMEQAIRSSGSIEFDDIGQ